MSRKKRTRARRKAARAASRTAVQKHASPSAPDRKDAAPKHAAATQPGASIAKPSATDAPETRIRDRTETVEPADAAKPADAKPTDAEDPADAAKARRPKAHALVRTFAYPGPAALAALAVVFAGCPGAHAIPPAPALPAPVPVAEVVVPPPAPADAGVIVAPPPDAAAIVAAERPPAAPTEPEVWLKGSTHVHAKASGDSQTPIPEVARWYEKHGYDFIVITDHNQVSEFEPGNDTRGKVAIRNNGGMIVLAGMELTYNPRDCIPKGDASRRCQIHVNAIGATARPGGKLDWADRKTHLRVEKYQSAIVAGHMLGGVLQFNHPNWFWGTNVDVLAGVTRRGIQLVEIWNAQFPKWNVGDKDHLSTEALWDGVLVQGLTLYGVASDDAHDYGPRGKYRAGGGWIVVRARRDPQAIVDSIGEGRFYASNGVALEHAEASNGALVVEVAASETGSYSIDFVENGKRVDSVKGRSAQRIVPPLGYVRAVVTRDDGKKAWTQPVRR